MRHTPYVSLLCLIVLQDLNFRFWAIVDVSSLLFCSHQCLPTDASYCFVAQACLHPQTQPRYGPWILSECLGCLCCSCTPCEEGLRAVLSEAVPDFQCSQTFDIWSIAVSIQSNVGPAASDKISPQGCKLLQSLSWIQGRICNRKISCVYFLSTKLWFHVSGSEAHFAVQWYYNPFLKFKERVVIENSHAHTFSQPSRDFTFLGVKRIL